jgi:N-acetylmuramoyl-L-alanine amidase
VAQFPFNSIDSINLINPLNAFHPLAALACLCLLALGIAGCATGPGQNGAHDWKDTTVTGAPAVSAVPPEPLLAPPPSNPPSAMAAPPHQPLETWTPLQRWAKANDLPAPVRFKSAPQPTYTLRSGNGTFLLRAGSQLAEWNGMELRLGFAPQMIDGQPYLHALDLRKTLLPLLAGNPAPCLSGTPVIVLDPGHGGSDSGTRSVVDGRYEKEFTLDWALRLRQLLVANGWEVFLTRSRDVDVALSNRVAFAEEHKASLFLSLHFNSAAPNESEIGLETYCLTPSGMPSSLTRGFADDAALSFPNNAFDAQNLLLALRVHRALLQVNGRHDRGVRRARFPAVLRWQQRPAILLEGGYLSNPREARQIADPAYRQKLAEAVAGALGRQEVGDRRMEIGAGSQETGDRSPKSKVQSPVLASGLLPPASGKQYPASDNRRPAAGSQPPASNVADPESASHNPELP